MIGTKRQAARSEDGGMVPRGDDTAPAIDPAECSAGPGANLLKAGAIANLAVIGGLLLTACLFAVVLAGRPKSSEFLSFVFLAGLAPPLAAVGLFAARWRGAANAMLGARIFLGLAMTGALLMGALEYALHAPLPTSIVFLIVVLFCAVAAAGFLRSPYIGWIRLRAISGQLDAALVVLLVLVAFFFSPFDPAKRLPELLDYVHGAPRILGWLLFGIVAVAAAAWLRSIEARWPPGRATWFARGAFVLLALFILTLFDDDLYLNVEHYLVHMGPAMHSIYGGIAMVDVFCIYGLMPWLLVKAALVTVAPTFGAMAITVRLTMLAYYLAMCVALYAVSRRRLSAVALMLPFMLVATTFHPGLLNLNGLPSTSGLRYLVPALMVAVLTAVRPQVWSTFLAMVLLVLASLWSIEAFVYTLAPWGYLLFLQTVRSRSIAKPGATLLAAIVLVALAQVAFVYGTHTATGQWVNYGPYLGLIANFRPDQAGFWAQAADPNFAMWVPVWLGLFLVLATAGYQALRGREPTDTASRLVPVAAFGFAELNYFAGFPAWSSLGLAFLPVAIVIICSVEALSERPRQYGPAGKAALLSISAVVVVLVAFGTERFAREPLYDQGNRNVLRRCFTAEGCRFAEIPPALRQRIYASPLDPNSPVYQTLHDQHPVNMPQWFKEDSVEGYERVREVVAILRTLPPNKKPAGILTDTVRDAFVSVVALVETGGWYTWPISSPLNDNISPGVTQLILDAMAKGQIHDGEIVILSNMPGPDGRASNNPEKDRLLTLEEKMLAVIQSRCELQLVETRKYNSVLRTANCKPLAGPAKGS